AAAGAGTDGVQLTSFCARWKTFWLRCAPSGEVPGMAGAPLGGYAHGALDMRSVVLDAGFGLERLTLVERETPRPGPGQVLLRVHAVSLNPRDLLMVQGAYYPTLQLPLVVASDAAASVVEQGAGVAAPRVGARVCPLF